MKLSHRAAAVATAVLLSWSLASPAIAKSPGGAQQTSVVYNSVVASPLPGNLPSVGAEAYAFNEFGNEVDLAGTNRQLTNAVVTMSSWGCETGHWYSGDCATSAGATFSVPITFNVYKASTDGGVTPGDLITTVTQTFAIPYRPSASPRCKGDDAGKWYDSSLKSCFSGKAVNVTFNLGGVTATDTVVFGIAYNTTHFGYSPVVGATCPSGGCGYDSLNIALSQDPTDVTAGVDTNQGTVWQNSPVASMYCDGTTTSPSTFRLDSPDHASCWGVDPPYTTAPYYVPPCSSKQAEDTAERLPVLRRGSGSAATPPPSVPPSVSPIPLLRQSTAAAVEVPAGTSSRPAPERRSALPPVLVSALYSADPEATSQQSPSAPRQMASTALEMASSV